MSEGTCTCMKGECREGGWVSEWRVRRAPGWRGDWSRLPPVGGEGQGLLQPFQQHLHTLTRALCSRASAFNNRALSS